MVKPCRVHYSIFLQKFPGLFSVFSRFGVKCHGSSPEENILQCSSLRCRETIPWFFVYILISSFHLVMCFQNFLTLSAGGIKLPFFVKVCSDSSCPFGQFFSKKTRWPTLTKLCCAFVMGYRPGHGVESWGGNFPGVSSGQGEWSSQRIHHSPIYKTIALEYGKFIFILISRCLPVCFSTLSLLPCKC